MSQEIFERDCPICKELRIFVRVVEAHIAVDEPVMDGVPLNRYVSETELPLARCPVCSIVVYVGPSPEELREELQEQKEARQRGECEVMVFSTKEGDPEALAKIITGV